LLVPGKLIGMADRTLRLVNASALRFPVNWRMALHAHEHFHELIVLEAGAIEVRMPGQATRVVKAGESVLYPMRQPHEERSVGRRPVSMHCLSFRGELESTERLRAPSLEALTIADAGGRVRLLAGWLCDRAAAPLPAAVGERMRSALLTAILAERVGATSSAPSLASRVRQYVAERPTEAIHLADLAADSGASPFHFARRFKAEAGVSPMRFVRSVRVEMARALILTQRLPLREVARRVGLTDEFHLSRVFKRETGVPPSRTV
jgi:AraC-like DNA-binding protein/mannose-6-phosphate isomerase-like protein (cupin superfamily)